MEKEKEVWIKIHNYEGLYEVSNYGQVRRSEGLIVINSNNQSKVSQRHMSKKILKLADNGLGYQFVKLYKHGKAKKMYVHRLVAEAFLENKHNKREVNHKDGNKTNNCLDNLEWVTRQENIRHAYDNGLYRNKVA